MNVTELKNKLKQYAGAYYNTGTKLVTDEEFDRLKDYYEELSGEKFDIGSPVKVGNTVTLKHSYENLAGTLDKVNNIEQFKKWHLKIGKPSKMLASLKLDGNSIIVEYTKGILSQALTRGDEGVGKDLTDYFTKAKLFNHQNIVNLDSVIPDSDFAIAYEAVVSYANFERLKKETSLEYTNPRSAVVGILTTDGLKYSKYLSLVPLKIMFADNMQLERAEEIELIFGALHEGHNHPSAEHSLVNLQSLEELYDIIAEDRFSLDFMVDGVVVEVLDTSKRNKLGYSNNRPNFAVALKFPYIEKTTKLKNIIWYTDGNSAIYTPVAEFEPVILNGNTYTRTSLANLKRFNELELKAGDDLIFQLRNEVLGYVEKPDTKANQSNDAPRFKHVTKCRFCSAKLKVINDTFLQCVNDECDLVKIGNIQNFVEKLNIKGIKRNTVTDMYHHKFWTNIVSLFTFDYDKLIKIEGYGKTSANNLKKSFDSIKIYGIYDYEILGSLNVENLSRDRAKLIMKHHNFKDLINLKEKDKLSKLKEIHGVGDSIVQAVESTLDKFYEDTILALIKLIKVKVYKDEFTSKEVIDPHLPKFNLCVTGNLVNFERQAFKDIVEAKGHKLVSGVSKTTNYLITNDTSSGTVKNDKAKELGVTIINEAQAMIILNIGKHANKEQGSFDDDVPW